MAGKTESRKAGIRAGHDVIARHFGYDRGGSNRVATRIAFYNGFAGHVDRRGFIAINQGDIRTCFKILYRAFHRDKAGL